jgi:AcrR family transcriptional regulator
MSTSDQDTLQEDRFVDAAMQIISQDGWRGLTMTALAQETGEPLSALYKSRISKTGLLRQLIGRIDMTALDEADAGAPDTESPRDRLFDAIMLRFEALDPYRDAMRVLVHDLPRDPASAAALLPQIRRSLRWTLEAAGFSADGISGALRVRLLGLICWRSLRVWLDDVEDLARTMADLDRRLRKAGRWLVPKSDRFRSDAKASTRENPSPSANADEVPNSESGAA